MHNTEKANLEFQITFTEANIRFLAGAVPVNEALIAELQARIVAFKARLAEIK